MAALAELAGGPIEVTAHSVGRSEGGATLATNIVSLRLDAPPEGGDLPRWWVVLEVELAFAVTLVARVTKRPAPRVLHADLMTPALLGAFAAVVAAAVRRAGLTVLVSPASAVASPAAPPETLSVASATLVAFDQATHLRALFPRPLLSVGSPPLDRPHLAAQGDLPLSLPVVACRVVATAAEVASIGVGDAWRLDSAWKLGPPGGPRRGPIWLCAGGSERGVPADLEGDGKIVLRDGLEELSWSPMSDEATENAALVEAVGEVPVVVRVEIGAATMTAREWSALRAGDVVTLGSQVGAAVTLRVSGRAVAEGDLVDVDGEIGVRIGRRLGSDTT